MDRRKFIGAMSGTLVAGAVGYKYTQDISMKVSAQTSTPETLSVTGIQATDLENFSFSAESFSVSLENPDQFESDVNIKIDVTSNVSGSTYTVLDSNYTPQSTINIGSVPIVDGTTSTPDPVNDFSNPTSESRETRLTFDMTASTANATDSATKSFDVVLTILSTNKSSSDPTPSNGSDDFSELLTKESNDSSYSVDNKRSQLPEVLQ